MEKHQKYVKNKWSYIITPYTKKMASKMGSLYKIWHVFVLPEGETAPHHPHPTSVIGLCSFTSTGSGGGATGGSGRAGGLGGWISLGVKTTSWGRLGSGNPHLFIRGFYTCQVVVFGISWGCFIFLKCFGFWPSFLDVSFKKIKLKKIHIFLKECSCGSFHNLCFLPLLLHVFLLSPL